MPNNLVKIPLAISSSESYSRKNNNSDLINMYVHMEEAGSKSNHILINTPGTVLVAEAEYKILGTYEFLNVLYVATTNALYAFEDDTNFLREVGKVFFDSKVSFADNGIELIVVAENGYFYNPETRDFGTMEQEGWFPSNMVAYMDGYFIFNRIGSGQFFISKLFSHEIDPIDWASAEAAPDDTIGVIVSNRQLWIIGEKTSEVWFDSGDPDFPFTRIPGAVSDIGCSNHKTIEKIRENVFYTGEDNKVYMTVGYTPRPVSTPSIEKLISEVGRETLTAFSYTELGHWFYVLNIGDTHTMVYDVDTKQWHRRSTGDGLWSVQGAFNRFRTGQAFAYSNTLFHQLSIDFLTDNGRRIKREAVTLPVNKSVNRIRIHELKLDMEVGFDNKGEVLLQMSKDGGITWSNYHRTNTGSIGENRADVTWRRLGQARDAIFRITITDPIPIRIIGLYGRIS